MKRIIALSLLFVLFLTIIPSNTFATEVQSSSDEIIYLENGYYIVVELVVLDVRTSFTKAGSKTYTCYNNQNDALWTATLNGMFTYNGTTSTCKSAYCNITIQNDSWYEISKSVNTNGSTATVALTMGCKLLGIKINEKTISMTLTCDKDGNLS